MSEFINMYILNLRYPEIRYKANIYTTISKFITFNPIHDMSQMLSYKHEGSDNKIIIILLRFAFMKI